MFQLLKPAAWLLLLTCSLHLHAQNISVTDQGGLTATLKAFQDGFDKQEIFTNPIYEQAAVLISPQGEIVRGRAQILTYFTDLFAFFKTQPRPDRLERNNTDLQSRYLAPDLVLSTYTEETTRHFGSQTQVDKISFSLVMRKQKTQWLVELITLTPVTN